MSTIVVHGTLAKESTWWRAQESGRFLDSVARGMREGGREPDLWTIGGRPVSEFKILRPKRSWGFFGMKHPPFDNIEGHFCWSGANMHIERTARGEALARYLETLAEISPGETIDLIAHSHGGNLIKVATHHVAAHVPIGRVVLVACPHCENIAGGSSDYLYRLIPDALSRDAPASGPPVLNAYSEEDTVQADIADIAPDYLGSPGTPYAPVFDAHRSDPDPDARSAYEEFELPTQVGRGIGAHFATHSPTVGLVIGYWLACWPNRSGPDCLGHFGIDVLTDADSG